VGYKVYIGATAGSETLQGTVASWTAHSQAVNISAGAAPPVSNNTVCSLAFSDELIPTGTGYTVNFIIARSSKIPGFPQTWCKFGGAAGLPYFNPHSFRNTLVRLGQDICKTPEEFKAWSQNLGHDGVLTTFLSYGEVGLDRQREIIRVLATPQQALQSDANEIAEALFKKFRDSGVAMQVK
jgi:hypothetical protein